MTDHHRTNGSTGTGPGGHLKHNGKIASVEPQQPSSAVSSLKRNNSYHQRLKKSYSEQCAEYNNGQQSTDKLECAPVRSGSAKWKTKPVKPDQPAGVTSAADEFKRFHTLRNSYGGKSNLNVNSSTNGEPSSMAIKTQVLLHQQKLKEYSKHSTVSTVDPNNDSYSTCSSSQSDYQQPHKHHHHHRYHHSHHTQPHAQTQYHQQSVQYPVSATVAATATLTRPSGASILKNKDSAAATATGKNSLRRGAGGLSTLSLCSCEADTEIIPNPLRPLYQYSLDRKNPRQHTYTCEQNAQILMRLEKDRLRKFGSSGKLTFTSSTNDLTVLPSSHGGGGLQKSATTTTIPTATPGTNGIGMTSSASQAAPELLAGSCNNESGTSYDYHGGSNYIEDDSYVDDMMIPPPPPPLLNRRPSYGYSCIIPANETVVGGVPSAAAALANDLTSTMSANNGIINNYPSNQPDLFNFASASVVGTLKSTLKNKSTSRVDGGVGSGTPPAAIDVNKQQAKLKKSGSNFDIMNNGNASSFGVDGNGNAGESTLPAKQFPPYYFDDNYLNHSLHQHFYYQNPADGGGLGVVGGGVPGGGFPVSGVKNDTETGQMYLYHHEPASYMPNYDTLNLSSGKYNTIGPGGGGGGGGGGHPGDCIGKYGHHASSCNLNQFSGAPKSNLISSHQHHFSNSISNFNFNPSQYFGTGLEPPGATIIGGPGGVMGDGFTSSISLNGTPNKQQQQQSGHPWKHRQCPSRGSSSTGSGSSKWDLPSRQWLAVTSILLIAGAAGVAVPLALKVSAGAPLEERLQVAAQLLDTVPLIDGHNDLPWNIRKFLHNQLNEFRFDDDLRQILPWSKSVWSHTDLQRLKRGRVAAQFWAAFVPCEAQHKDAVQITLEQIDVIKRLTERYSPHLTACTSVHDIVEAHKNHQMCSLIGVEGGHSLGGSLGVLRIYYTLGVRYMTLTTTCHTPWADSNNADAPKYDVKHGGLTAYGKTIVREMNRLGMIVDLSRSSVATMKDVLATSQAPVIFSHSSAYALCNSSRNVQDEVLALLAKNRGLVMVNFYNKFLSCGENASVQDAAAHINHIRQIAGIDHVGLGAGYDGINFTPRGLEDVSSYPRLFAELLGQGWTAEELEQLAGRNLLRVLGAVEKVRENQRLSGVRPYEDIPPAIRPEEHANCTTNS
ncbi:uncharacterized protein LOC120419844 isoform X1 [Culex pipiens pallens]|nr:uncharacterized protein LOC120419844 isoform X1 [Culex pipiens pallens]